MRSLKFYLILGLAVLLSFSFSCKSTFSPDDPTENGGGGDKGVKFIFNTKVEYERLDPFISTIEYDSMVALKIVSDSSVEGWGDIQAIMKQISKKKFEYVAEKLPYETKLWMVARDLGRGLAGGPDFNGRKFTILGTELTEKFIRKDPWGNNWDVACFIIKKDNTILPWN
jgi:hypothetical protein